MRAIKEAFFQERSRRIKGIVENKLTLDDYRAECGFLGGLEHATRLLDETFKQLRKKELDDDSP